MKVQRKALLLLLLMLTAFAGRAFPTGKEGIKVIVIDAGHGGKDPGNLGTRRYATTEKDIALAVALKLGAYLEENFPEIKVVYTRKTDVFVPLKTRADIANEAKGDLFVSVHCDAFHQSSVHGATSLVLGRNHDDENRVAIRENSAILMEDNYEERYQGFDPRKPESLIALNLYQNNYLNQSVLLAKEIQDQFRERVNRRDRGVKQQPLYVTSRTAMPAVLVELGFLTNPQEEDFLNSEKGQVYMASAIFRAIRDYKVQRDQILAAQQVSQPGRRRVDQANPTPETPAARDKPETERREEPTSTARDSVHNPPVDAPPAPSEAAKKAQAASQAQSGESPGKASKTSLKPRFAVQILVSSSLKELVPGNFKGLEGVKYVKEDGLYKYFLGDLEHYAEAEALRQKVRQGGYRDAFVIGLLNGRKISALEARKMLR